MQIKSITIAWFFTASFLSISGFLFKNSVLFSRGWSIAWGLSSLGTLLISRLLLEATIRHLQSSGRLSRAIAIVGAGAVGRQVIQKIEQSSDAYVRIAGLFDDRSRRTDRIINDHAVQGTTDDLISWARTNVVDEIVIALPPTAAGRIGAIVHKLRSLSVDIRLAIEPETIAFPILGVGRTGPIAVMEIIDKPLKHWDAVTKRVEDIVLASILLVPLLPVMGLIALVIKWDSRGPALFAQDRFGFNNLPIRILKFRTMHVHLADPTGAARTVRRDPRITRVGWFLRTTSLDEFPQLFNVLRGEMSLVGPRPHAIAMRAGGGAYHETVNEYLLRHRMRPGLTGWAQVNGYRGEVDTLDKARKRVECDLYYIDHWSLWLDLKILVMTFKAVLGDKNAY